MFRRFTSFVRYRDPFKGEDIHVHFPAGGIPKDGPSAGVAVLLALASLVLNRPVRSDTAVTGEVTLRGHVLPVGGIRDKVLAAIRGGVKHVLLPVANKRHVKEDIPAKSLEGVQIHYLKTVDEALDWVFGSAEAPVNLDLATSSRWHFAASWADHTPELSDNANDEHEVQALAAGSILQPHLPTRRSTAMYPAQTCLRLAACPI
ncbi:Lon protease [Symbiodinium microadriaticum]|uniref:Lon protease n=1 Tax=Symbiodinium microadriaticum TaxID=2951 RepID=A0A1Q9C3Q4_SYMMI|nr:Lon protease [Symbiodinium microadriaticum]